MVMVIILIICFDVKTKRPVWLLVVAVFLLLLSTGKGKLRLCSN